jgi:hypothetical protein
MIKVPTAEPPLVLFRASDGAINYSFVPFVALDRESNIFGYPAWYLDGLGGQYDAGARMPNLNRQIPEVASLTPSDPHDRARIYKGIGEIFRPDIDLELTEGVNDLFGATPSAAGELTMNMWHKGEDYYDLERESRVGIATNSFTFDSLMRVLGPSDYSQAKETLEAGYIERRLA